jgi:putative transposase
VLTKLLKQTFEVALEGEIDAHFLANKAQEQGNRRNGKSKKTVRSAHGSFELETPRDRNTSFEPQ